MKRVGTNFATMTNVLIVIYGLSPTTYKVLPTLLLAYNNISNSLEGCLPSCSNVFKEQNNLFALLCFQRAKNLFNFSINLHIVISNFQVQHSSFTHTKFPLASLKLSLETPPRTSCAWMGKIRWKDDNPKSISLLPNIPTFPPYLPSIN
jgi:hypothetical protein